jgi:hypothetical protein
LFDFQLDFASRTFQKRLEKSLNVIRAVQQKPVILVVSVIALEHP